MHFQASYVAEGKTHEVEVWRDGAVRLKRKTDANLETYVTKAPKEVEWRMVVLDMNRKIRTDIDRTNLYRIGNFIDWFGLSHALSRPLGAYQLRAEKNVPATEKAIAACRWYTFTTNGRESKICWSNNYRLPLMILGPDAQVQWRITAVDTKAVAESVFAIHDQGFVRNNANEDIRAD